VREALETLRARLDALREGRAAPGLLARTWARLSLGEAPPRGEVLASLDRALDNVGVHTAADAALLKDLAGSDGRAGSLARGLTERADEAKEEFEDRVRDAELRSADGLPAGLLSALERDFLQLVRVARVAEIFAGAPSAGVERLDAATASVAAPPPSDPRVAVAAWWAERAKQETSDFVQKRRDLDRAHELLLRIGALDRERALELRTEVSAARERAREAVPARSLDALLRHVGATAQRDGAGAWKAVRSLYEAAVEAGDTRLAEAARGAVAALLPDGETLALLISRDERLSAVEWTAPSSLGWEPDAAKPTRGPDQELADLAFELGTEELEAFEIAAGCARFFDVEDALAQDVAAVDARSAAQRHRRVPYPTELLTFEHATGLHEARDFVIRDPRTLVYDLAAGQQQVRAYLEEVPPERPRKTRQTAVRVYVLDASGSMQGARARFRDALLIAELNGLRVKARKGRPVDPLYYCFFNDVPTELTRVEDAADAARELSLLFEKTLAKGRTDITFALVSAFREVHAARGRDPYLARATVVLVTDGEDRVDVEAVRAARKPVEDVEIAFSFISLGDENVDLRALVEEQRAAGGRAFYHHLSDAEISSVRTAFETRFRTLLPRQLVPGPEALAQLERHLQALREVAEGRRTESAGAVRSAASFDAFFPDGGPEPTGRAPRPTETEYVVSVVEAVADTAVLVPLAERAEEAVALVQHLLGVYGVSPEVYQAAIGGGGRVAAAVATVRRVCRPGAARG
jgi:Mg-chelatase subunit ChlD